MQDTLNLQERKIPDDEEAEKKLSQYLSDLYQSIERAVDDINNGEFIEPKLVNSLRDGTVSSMITDRAVHHLKEIFNDHDNLSYKSKKNTTIFRIKDFMIKVKKLNDNNLASYNHTKASRRFCSQHELFNGEYMLKSLHLGYKINSFGTLKDVVLTCPINGGMDNEWIIPISDTPHSEEAKQTDNQFNGQEDDRLSAKQDSASESKDARTGS